jgi:signal transduction histidine kinase
MSSVPVSDASIEERLRDSRARLLAASDDERRRIERELHDGVQQQLVALSVNLQLARQLVASDTAAALEVLEEIRRDVHDALVGVQALAQRVYPGLLEARGLGDALRDAASAAGVPARVDVDGGPRFPPAVETTAYFCCLEALANAAAHAGEGARATVRVEGGDAALRFEVVDDGCGFDAAAHPPGCGLTHARDRVEALGGELTIESEPGRGTRVAGELPLYDRPSAR